MTDEELVAYCEKMVDEASSGRSTIAVAPGAAALVRALRAERLEKIAVKEERDELREMEDAREEALGAALNESQHLLRALSLLVRQRNQAEEELAAKRIEISDMRRERDSLKQEAASLREELARERSFVPRTGP